MTIMFLSLQEFEQFLLVHTGVLNTKKVWPKNLQILTYKLEFQEFLSDEYYSDHLIPEVLKSNTLREFNLET